jgi:hypothetical protein
MPAQKTRALNLSSHRRDISPGIEGLERLPNDHQFMSIIIDLFERAIQVLETFYAPSLHQWAQF